MTLTLRKIALLAALAVSPRAVAGELPQVGVSTLDRLETGSGLAVETVAQLRMRGAGLRFAGPVQDPEFPTLELFAGECVVTLQDRDENGSFETRTVRDAGGLASQCPSANNTADREPSARVLEAGEDMATLSNCRFKISERYTVECQPTRFGRDTGEPWTVLSGFTDAHMRQAMGRPADLAWASGLLVLDDESGVVYRVVPAPATKPPEKEATTAPVYQILPPPPPSLTRTSRLGDLPVSRERQKVRDDQEKTFSKYRKTPEQPELDPGAPNGTSEVD